MARRTDHDCIIVGGGPAGLTAAIYLARYHLSVAVFDDGRSRAETIPLTRNLPAYPVGVSGRDLLRRMRVQAQGFGATLIEITADTLARRDEGFVLEAGGERFGAARVLLATGVINLAPPMEREDHQDALRRGLLRYCPICDGFEVTDRDIAVLGTGAHGLAEAQFLRSYSSRVSLVAATGFHRLNEQQRASLAHWGIAAVDGPVTAVKPLDRQIALKVAERELRFDTLYPALGTEARTELARAAGADTGVDGALLVDRHQMTSVAGLYAAGDVVKGLDQIATAMGQAAVAATAIRNDLCAEDPLRR